MAAYDDDLDSWKKVLAMLDNSAVGASLLGNEGSTSTQSLTNVPFDTSSPDFSSTQASMSPLRLGDLNDVPSGSWSASPGELAQSLPSEDWYSNFFDWGQTDGGLSVFDDAPKQSQFSTSSPTSAFPQAEVATTTSTQTTMPIRSAQVLPTVETAVETTVKPFLNRDIYNLDNPHSVSPAPLATDEGIYPTSPTRLQNPQLPLSTPTHSVQPSMDWQAYREYQQAFRAAFPGSPSAGRENSSSLSPEPVPKGGSRKRKSPSDSDSSPTSKTQKGPLGTKTAHNEIEKRYRMNINNRITELKNSVPSLRAMSQGSQGGGADMDDLDGEVAVSHKLNKATILSKATEYIRLLEKRNRRLNEECEANKNRLVAFEKLAVTGGFGNLEFAQEQPDAFLSYDLGSNQGMGAIPPQDTIRLLQHQHQRQQARQTAVMPGHSPPRTQQGGVGRGNRRALGRLMVGSMAGLMIMEGLRENEQKGDSTSARGLFSLPLDLLRHLRQPLSRSQGGSFSLDLIFLWAKVAVLFGAVIYVVLPSLFDPKSADEKKPAPILSASAAPGSPREVRKRAWTTAMQTLHFPHRPFLEEPMPFVFAALRYCLRYLLPSQLYAYLFHRTGEQELARNIAWGMALDAQLMGGDAEMSTSRLALTLVASGTVPNTPTRLMLRALHVRVLFADRGYVLQQVARHLSRRYWDEARALHEMTKTKRQAESSDGKGAPQDPSEALPRYLAALLDLDCEGVMLDDIIRRAYSLAWGRPTSEGLSGMDEGMDAIVDDFSIRTPLDALAAWWSSFTLHQSLLRYTEAGVVETETDPDLARSIQDAIRVAPPTSGAHLRALVARAVTGAPDSAKTSLASALEVLPNCEIYRVQQTNLTAVPAASKITTTGIRVALRCSTALACLLNPDPGSSAVAVKLFNGLLLDKPDSCAGGPRIGLLGFVAAWKTLVVFSRDKKLTARTRARLENVALGLRVWIGGARGRNCGLSQKQRIRIVEGCLDISRRLLGIGDGVEEG